MKKGHTPQGTGHMPWFDGHKGSEKIGRKIAYAYIAFLAAAFLLIAAEYIYADSGISYDARVDVNQVELVPDYVENLDEDTREFYFSVVRVFGEADCLLFCSSHQNVAVYQGDKMVYQLKKGEGIFDRTTGFHWNFVQLEQKASPIRIQVEALYPQMREYKLTFYQGNAFKMFMEYVRDSFSDILVSILDVAIGLLLLAYWITLRKRLKGGKGLLYFGIFCILMGLWSFGETAIFQMVIRNRPAASDMGYIMIMLFPIPFILFAKEFLETEENKVSSVICILSFTNSFLAIILHLTGFLAYKQTAVTTHFLVVASLCYMVYSLCMRKKKMGVDSRVWVNLLGLVVLAVTCIMDFSSFYVMAGRADIFGRIGLLLYVILVGYQTAKDTLKQLDEGYEAERSLELADKDNLTGLYNRNTYNRWVKDHPRPEGTTIFTFDLNYLKKCNDTLGHAMGDLYIQNAAHIIEKVFGEKCRCYRIGGDEFCAIVDKVMSFDDAEKKFKEIEELEKEYTKEDMEIPLQIAHGYACFDKYQDANIEKCRERADKKMYENKELRKEKG